MVFHKGDSLMIPNSAQTAAIREKLNSMIIDVNIPEYKERIVSGNNTLYTFSGLRWSE